MPYQTRKFYEDQGKLFLEGRLILEPSSDETRSMVLEMFNNLKGKSVLNIGIGPKPLIDIELLKMGYSVVGIDISYSFIIAAKGMFQQNNVEAKLIVSEAINLPFCNGIFDPCLCSEVIEHLKEPEILLKEISRVLKVGGKLILTTPNKFSLSKVFITLRKMLHQEKAVSNPAHEKEYSYYEISRLCRKFFKLRAYHYTGAFPTQGLSFLKAPMGRICNFMVNLPYLNKLFPNTMGFIFEKVSLKNNFL